MVRSWTFSSGISSRSEVIILLSLVMRRVWLLCFIIYFFAILQHLNQAWLSCYDEWVRVSGGLEHGSSTTIINRNMFMREARSGFKKGNINIQHGWLFIQGSLPESYIYFFLSGWTLVQPQAPCCFKSNIDVKEHRRGGWWGQQRCSLLLPL